MIVFQAVLHLNIVQNNTISKTVLYQKQYHFVSNYPFKPRKRPFLSLYCLENDVIFPAKCKFTERLFMEWIKHDLKKIPRQSNFPLQISSVYYCYDCVFHRQKRTMSDFEVSLRLGCSANLCRDLVDGTPINLPYPHTVFKVPGMETCIGEGNPRNIISFTYGAADCELLRKWDLIPEEKYWQIELDSKMEDLISNWRRLLLCCTSEGMIDQLDWICFQILRELLFFRQKPLEEKPAERIRKASLYLEQHYDKKINCDVLAAKFGFSHASFFRHWKMQFDCSPQEYLRNYRLKIAGLRLARTKLSIAEIVREVHFSSIAAFHRDFKVFYGKTPAQFRHTDTDSLP